MKKLTLLLMLFTAFAANAQKTITYMNKQTGHKEGSGAPSDVLKQQRLHMMDRYYDMQRNQADFGEGTPCYRDVVVIPVAVHVLWFNQIHNISSLQIESQLDLLKQFMAGQYPGTATAPAFFQNQGIIAGDTKFVFRLAKTDPDGNGTTGITRTQVNKQEFNILTDEAKFTNTGGFDAWPTDAYLNVWVVPRISYPGLDPNLIILGYAQFPGGPAGTDGLVMAYDWMGDPNHPQADMFEMEPRNDGQTLVHEFGHWAGVYHINDTEGQCVDDGVADTPIQDTNYIGETIQWQASCGNQLDQTFNVMNYAAEGNFYSIGQVSVMRATFGEGGFRSSFQKFDQYPISYGLSSNHVWINSVQTNQIQNVSGSDGGYGDYRYMTEHMRQGDFYTMKVTIGRSPLVNGEGGGEKIRVGVRVVADINHDGYFDYTKETVMYSPPSQADVFTTLPGIKIPKSAVPGNTRLRVVAIAEGEPNAQGIYDNGETEDYCLLIHKGYGDPDGYDSKRIEADVVTLSREFKVYPNPVKDILNVSWNADRVKSVGVYSIDGRIQGAIIDVQKGTIDVGSLETGNYILNVTTFDGVFNSQFVKE